MKRFTWIAFFAVCLTTLETPAAELEERSPRELVRRGMNEFRAGKIADSIKSFEAAAKLQPNLRPELWQLGISYYYAGEFAKGHDLFEAHQKVNPQDVENAIWHFLCVTKLDGIDKARQKFISITDDRRIPMKELHRLFAGKASNDDVLAVAGRGAGEDLKNQMFYAYLYLALHEEALGHAEESLKMIGKANEEFGQTHYMGAVARVHQEIREKSKGK